jgi:molybdopterin-guanine dinucleotide biosynthesis protein A
MQSKAEPWEHCAAAMVGVVIAGGRSRRFGAEKAVAQLGGRPLLLWAAERLARSCSRVAVCSPAIPDPITRKRVRIRSLRRYSG